MRRSRFSGFGLRPRSVGLVLALALTSALWVPLAEAARQAGTVERVSLASDGAERSRVPVGSETSCSIGSTDNCTLRSISADGSKVVFTSAAPNIVPGDTNGVADVFVATIDNALGTLSGVSRVSVDANGAQGNGPSDMATISPNGMWAAFASTAFNLIGNDTNGVQDIYAVNLASPGSIVRASVPESAAVGQADGHSFYPAVADDGTVTFTSYAHNLTTSVPVFQNVFVRRGGHTYLVSRNASGGPANNPSLESSIDASGTKIAFTSRATDMTIETDTAEGADIFVASIDAITNAISMKRITNNPHKTTAGSFAPQISADGDQVAFPSEDSLDGSDSEGTDPTLFRKDVYVSSTSSPNPTLVSGPPLAPAAQWDRPAVLASVDNNGIVAWQSPTRYTEDGKLRQMHIWRSTSPISRVSETGLPGNDESYSASISALGNHVVFTSKANNLVPGDGNNVPDVFRKDLNTGNVIRVSVGPGGVEASGFAELPVAGPAVSADGNLVAFESDSPNLIGGDDGNGVTDIFLRDRFNNQTSRMSVSSAGAPANGPSANPAISADGTWVAFQSTASNLVDNDNNQQSDVFIHNRNSGETRRASVGDRLLNGGMEGVNPSQNPSISPNGEWVAFESSSALAAPASGQGIQVFLYHVSDGRVSMVSQTPQHQAPDRDSLNPSVADDGSVAFESIARKMTEPNDPQNCPKPPAVPPAGCGPNAIDIYVRRPNGTTVKASVANDGTTADQDSSTPALSGNGRVVAFASKAGNLGPFDGHVDPEIFVRDLAAGQTRRISGGMGGEAPNGPNTDPSINHDGSLVAFASMAPNLVPNDNNGLTDVFLANAGGETVRVSMNPSPADGDGQGNGPSVLPAITGDGKSVAFQSVATNLVPNDGNQAYDTFVRDYADGDGPAPCIGSTCPAGGSGGYRFVAADGGIFSYGSAGFLGSAGDKKLNRPIVGMASTPDNKGYWLVASDGGIFSFGNAAFHGSTGALRLNSPIVGMTAHPGGRGYWFVAADGGIFSFGDAKFFGSMGGKPLNRPIVGMATTPSGNGYWLVASDGGIFAFGDAKFYGSTGNIKLNRPIVGMAATAAGYRFVASDGGIFSFGDAKFFGSMGGKPLNRPIVGMATTRSNGGYYLVATDGGIFSFGDGRFFGSTGAIKLNSPIVGMTS
jgi:Tol biopolymer transport system component